MLLRIPRLPRLPIPRFLCCTGYELLKVTATVPYSSTGAAGGAPLNVTCPAGKYLLDLFPDFGVVQQFTGVQGGLTTTTLPDGRMLPTGWTGVAWQSVNPSPPTPTWDLTFRCIYA